MALRERKKREREAKEKEAAELAAMEDAELAEQQATAFTFDSSDMTQESFAERTENTENQVEKCPVVPEDSPMEMDDEAIKPNVIESPELEAENQEPQPAPSAECEHPTPEDSMWVEVKAEEASSEITTESQLLTKVKEAQRDENDNEKANKSSDDTEQHDPEKIFFARQRTIEEEEGDEDSGSDGKDSSTEVSESESVFMVAVKDEIIPYMETLKQEALLQKRSFTPDEEQDQEVISSLAVDLAEAAADLPKGAELKQSMEEVIKEGDRVFQHGLDSDDDEEGEVIYGADELMDMDQAAESSDSGCDGCEVDSPSLNSENDMRKLQEIEDELLSTLDAAEKLGPSRDAEQVAPSTSNSVPTLSTTPLTISAEMETELKDKCRPIVDRIINTAEEIVNEIIPEKQNLTLADRIFNLPRDASTTLGMFLKSVLLSVVWVKGGCKTLNVYFYSVILDDGIGDVLVDTSSSEPKQRTLSTWDNCWEINDVKPYKEVEMVSTGMYFAGDAAAECPGAHASLDRTDSVCSTLAGFSLG